METIILDIERGRTDGDGMEEKVESPKLEHIQTAATTITTKATIHCEPNKTPPSIRQQSKRKDSASVQENVHTRKTSTSSSASLPGLHALYRRPDFVTRSVAPIIPKGELIPLKPRIVGQINALPEHKKTKPPKFVPYEPYPGAVNPIDSTGQCGSGHSTPRMLVGKKNKNNLDIGVLVSQMSTMRTQELGENLNTFTETTPEELVVEIAKLKEDLKKANEERDYFQGQFKFQTQVNSELKNLLVASVGEDLQTHVNVLTEDKLQLARALLDTANNLTTHTEQIEFLAGQCEVWRSKFLASSVMIEELARWKADLTHKNQMLNESTRTLLQSMHQLREMQLEILKNLKFVAKIRYLNLPTTDVFSLSGENLNILQQMVLHAPMMHGIPEAQLNISSASTDPLCEAEKRAVQALELVSQPLMATDEAIRALFGQTQRPYGNLVSTAYSDDINSVNQTTGEGNTNEAQSNNKM